jgi:hypothetical protein
VIGAGEVLNADKLITLGVTARSGTTPKEVHRYAGRRAVVDRLINAPTAIKYVGAARG